MAMGERITGLWWFSDKDIKTAVPGDLYIQERKLELNGCLSEELKSIGGKIEMMNIDTGKTIFGISKTGISYTLEFFDSPGFSMPISGYRSETYSLRKIIEGTHFSKSEDFKFSRYEIEFPYLYEWFGKSMVSFEFETGEKDGNIFFNSSIKIQKPTSILFYQDKKIRLSYYIKVEQKSSGIPMGKEVLITQTPTLLVEVLHGKHRIQDITSLSFHIAMFLSLAIGESLEAMRYLSRSKEGRDIQIFPYYLDEKTYKKLNPIDVNFSFSDIAGDIQSILEKWFSQKEKYEDVFNLLSNIYLDSNKNLNNLFKDIYGAIEGYVCIKNLQQKTNPNNAMETLNELFPENRRILTKNDINRIHTTRNKLSHLVINPKNDNLILSETEKWIYFEKLKFLLEYSFLRDLGMSDKLLEKFYQNRKPLLNIQI